MVPAAMPFASGKYARVEIERRYLVRSTPPLPAQSLQWKITDRYLEGTRLRLRRMVPLQAGQTVYKLGQKFRAPGQEHWERMMTSIYLDPEEYALLETLPGREIVKTRRQLALNERTYGVDRFAGPLERLVIAEIECRTPEEFMALDTPLDWIDVTGDPFFSGGELSRLSRAAFESGLHSRMGGE